VICVTLQEVSVTCDDICEMSAGTCNIHVIVFLVFIFDDIVYSRLFSYVTFVNTLEWNTIKCHFTVDLEIRRDLIGEQEILIPG